MKNCSLIFFVMVLLLTSCSDNARDESLEEAVVYGLATPVQLAPIQTELDLSDYFLNVNAIDQVEISEGFAIDWKRGEAQAVIRVLSGAPMLGVMRVNVGARTIDMLVRKSQKKAVSVVFDPGNTEYDQVQLVGDMNAWNPANSPMELNESGTYGVSFYANPGVYGYQFVLDGEWILDPQNPDSLDNGIGGFNSRLEVAGPPENKAPRLRSTGFDGEYIHITARNVVDIKAFWQNQEINVIDDKLAIPDAAGKLNRSYIRVYASSSDDVSNDLLIPLDKGVPLTEPEALQRTDKHAIRMYFPMVDRFNNARSDNDHPVDNPEIHPKANHMGGDLAGVIAKIQDGYFQDLGINTIWLSPIPRNAEGAWGLWDEGGVRSKFSAYHGYWPVSFTSIDHRFGTEREMDMLVGSAHRNDMNVLIDFVANHVHQNHPIYQAHKDDGWATDLYLPDGTLNTERWDDHRLTTWFDTFLPTLELRKFEVTDMLSDSAVYWLRRYEIDGFRHDATKHIPEIFWRTLTDKVKAYAMESDRVIYQVGETYGTPELISSYLNSGMLDAQFDFNVYDALVNSICREDVGFGLVKRRVNESLQYYGSHHLMGNMSGNQDKPRLMSLATGEVRFDEDTKLAGWTRDINEQSARGFQRVALMHMMNFTLPGVPCVYYGDEIGMPGGNDPDNRRMMRFSDITSSEEQLRSMVAKLAKWRRDHLSLIYGDTEWLSVAPDALSFIRHYMDESTVIFANNSDEVVTFKVKLPVETETADIESFSGHSYAISGRALTIGIPAGQFEILTLSK